MVELRWIVPEHTTTELPRLQYRNWGQWPAGAGPWQDVPTVVIPQESPKPAPTALTALGVSGRGNQALSQKTPQADTDDLTSKR